MFHNNAHTPPTQDTETGEPLTPEGDAPLTLAEYTEFIREMEQQPSWRGTADKEMDYADGNQLDTDLQRANAELGIPPAVEDKIGPMLLALQGYEATIRTDWRVKPNGNPGGQDVADALNFKLNEAERHSKADRACSDAFRPQAGIGIGFVEVSRSSDPFRYPYQCLHIPRTEMHWDWASSEDFFEDGRYMRRLRWLHPSRLEKVFKEHKELIRAYGKHGASWWSVSESIEALEGGGSTGLRNAWNEARSWTVTEDRWYNPMSKEVCVAEVWYRRWVEIGVITAADGRVVEYDEDNQAHNYALATGTSQYTVATVARMRRSYWLGPHCLHDSKSPYSHRHFPYVPFFGFREDNTRVPYGYVRGVIYQQDSLNSGSALLRWGMGAVRTERTKGAVAMTDEQYRKQIGRRNADIVLNAAAMSQPGARHDLVRDFQLTDQQFRMLDDARNVIDRISAAPSAFVGRTGSATSGLQEQTQVEQANQSLGRIMDNFRAARTQVGELLLSMIVDDIGGGTQAVVIPGDAVSEPRTVHLNKPEVDELTGFAYLSNDLQRTRLMVALDDVPSTSTYQGQQLNALSEATKSMPAQFQSVMAQYLVALTDIPFKDKITEALRAAAEQESPDQIEKRIAQAVSDALAKAGNDLKARELDMKERLTDAQIEKLIKEAVNTGITSTFAAMQAAEKIAMNPAIAPVGDIVMQQAGWRQPLPGGQDPDIPAPAQAMQVESAGGLPGDTSPTTPDVPTSADIGANEGIETLRTD